MFSAWQRLQNTSSWALSVCLTLLAVISVSSWYVLPTVPLGSIDLKSFQVVPGSGSQSNLEYALMRLDVQSDLTPLFANWNTKQLYVSVVADWNSTVEGTQSSVVLWDRIITRKRPEAAKLSIEGLKAKNVWKVRRGGFKTIPSCHLSLKYDIMPYVGIVTPGIGARARNPTWNVTTETAKNSFGEWDIAVPGVKSGGVGS
ncbi:signal peptidase subunit [Filobasidium floriforme]|uniref:signal peptidase subunit n=1 Tax=Filobasidium floriforme TaxID=5210 RepID=UPI001E8EB9E6|nr:signal peptidase subunit [Filobasidium floriforme]KAH8089187.1 signal peptidase subunit [Filobasidium floriforme]